MVGEEQDDRSQQREEPAGQLGEDGLVPFHGGVVAAVHDGSLASRWALM